MYVFIQVLLYCIVSVTILPLLNHSTIRCKYTYTLYTVYTMRVKQVNLNSFFFSVVHNYQHEW